MTVHVVEGHAFHDQFARGRASGEIRIDDHCITFTNAKATVSLPIAGVTATLGGASDRLVFLAHPDYPDWKLYTADLSVLDNRHLHRDASVSRQLKKARNLRVFNWSVFATVTLLVVGFPLMLLFRMDMITGWIAPTLPAEWEESVGESAFAQYKINTDLIDGDEATAALEALTGPLVSAVESERYTFRIHIADDPTLNAFALPGGYIVLNSGLLLRAEDASEVLGVLAHEIAHVTQQHGIRQVMGRAGLLLTVQALVGDVGGVMATVAAATPLLLSQSYSRGFEADADDYGFVYLEQANIDPRGLVSFFEKVMEEEQRRAREMEDDDTRDAMEAASALLSSHPATEDRIEAMRERLEESDGDYRSLQPAFEQLRALVREAVADPQAHRAPLGESEAGPDGPDNNSQEANVESDS